MSRVARIVKDNDLIPTRLLFDPFGSRMKVYHDGHHFVGIKQFFHEKKKHDYRYEENKELNEYFDYLYFTAIRLSLTHQALRNYLFTEIQNVFPDLDDLENYVENRISQKIHNFYSRLKRFKRKANLNKWNYFVTLTYDSAKMDEFTFRRKLRKCLCNLHCRKGWKYMGVFERSPVEDRLHFHALIYIPDGAMIGDIVEERSYSTKKKAMQVAHINSFFAKKFGRNDFAHLDENDIKFGGTIEYITKYLHKTNEKIVYSRGIPTELHLFIKTKDIATEYLDFVVKYVLFDDCISSDGICKGKKDIRYKQLTFYNDC